jgi:hypothetical protein
MLVRRYGLSGAAFSWIFNNALTFVLSLRWVFVGQGRPQWLKAARCR